MIFSACRFNSIIVSVSWVAMRFWLQVVWISWGTYWVRCTLYLQQGFGLSSSIHSQYNFNLKCGYLALSCPNKRQADPPEKQYAQSSETNEKNSFPIFSFWDKVDFVLKILRTREIPAFGGISLALRGSGAYGAAFGAPLKKEQKNWGAEGAPLGAAIKKIINLGRLRHLFQGAPAVPKMVSKTWPVPWRFRICAGFWNWTTGNWFLKRTNRITESSSTVLVSRKRAWWYLIYSH